VKNQIFMLMLGPEITHDLIQLLQKRLDDAVLNEIILTLSRNPMYKLSPEDVQVSLYNVNNCHAAANRRRRFRIDIEL